MRGRVVILSLLLGLLSSPAFSQCTWSPRQSASFRTTALDLAIDTPYLWLATGYGIQLLQDGGTRVAGALAIPGQTRVVRADGRGLAYVGSGSRLYVVRRSGTVLSIVRFVEAGAAINDLLLLGTSLYAGTTGGLAQFDLLDPLHPVKAQNLLPTSSPNVTSMAAAGTKLYAADGDSSLEVFSISIPTLPQHTGEIATVARATAVHAVADGTLFVSDAFGQNTDVVSGTTTVGRLPVGASSFAASANGAHFVAGPDRVLRAVDFSSTSTLKELFEHQLAPTGGTDNVIHALAREGNTLYVAAGDIGLAIFDIHTLTPPYPLASYNTGGKNSTVVSGDRAWFGDGTGNVSEQRIVPSGLSLATVRSWNAGATVHDVEGPGLLTSSDRTVTLWSLTPDVPVSSSTSTFRSAVLSAAIRGTDVVALLSDGTVWTGGATPQQIAMPVISQLVRAGSSFLFVEALDTGQTILHFHATGDLAAETRRVTLDGVATGKVALDSTRAAVFTYRGVTIVDVATGATRVVDGSNRTIPRQLSFSDDDLLLLDKRSLFVYDDARTLVREQFLPADGVQMDAQASLAVVATTDGMLALSYLAEPPSVDTPFGNTFYTKVASSEDRMYLFAPGHIDAFRMSSNVPQYVTSVLAGGIFDLAATADGLFTLSVSGVVTAWSRQGGLLRQVTLNEGADAQPLAIDVAGNAVWVSFSKGCLSGGCQQKTLVLDPASLAITATLTGGVRDVVTAGARAYALFDFPAEVRVLNIADPRQPSQVAAIPAPPSATSLAASTGRVWVLGDKLYEYAESTMLLTKAHLDAVTPDKAAQVRVDGNCLVVTARGPNPNLYTAPTLAAGSTFEVPAVVRAMTTQPGRLLLLTTHSFEIWSSSPAPPERRRAVR